ncbi:CBS domain containing protein [Halorhabdus tiamatea SARL4B]|uniref:CBS domain containing protein n=1 Tax=Halorhabdus tiamatea SARL4B TaxID=1033806 RepID=U2DIC0_9EURY|nr:CBS domain-containing protein [Halorhabdus tiamatea]ERJ05697.1 CBS domain containing protein [Halorhabdus tiamatea SARL4B]
MASTTGCTAGELATPNPDHRTIEDSPDDVLTWLHEQDYDSTPIYENGQPVGYVTPEMLSETETESLGDALSRIHLDIVIANDASLMTVLEALTERPFYYLADRNQVTGVLTRADLNTDPVYRQLYTDLSHLERKFRDHILTYAPDWRDLPEVSPALDDIKDRHSNAKAAGVALDPIHYAQFSTLVTVISSVEDCWNSLGFDADHQASSRLDDIVELRKVKEKAPPFSD